MKYIVVWHNLLDGEWYGYQEWETKELAIIYSDNMRSRGFVTTIIQGEMYECPRSSKKAG